MGILVNPIRAPMQEAIGEPPNPLLTTESKPTEIIQQMPPLITLTPARTIAVA